MCVVMDVVLMAEYHTNVPSARCAQEKAPQRTPTLRTRHTLMPLAHSVFSQLFQEFAQPRHYPPHRLAVLTMSDKDLMRYFRAVQAPADRVHSMAQRVMAEFGSVVPPIVKSSSTAMSNAKAPSHGRRDDVGKAVPMQFQHHR